MTMRRRLRPFRVLLLSLCWSVLLALIFVAIERACEIRSGSVLALFLLGGLFGAGYVLGLGLFNRLIAGGRLRWFVTYNDSASI
jgi:hypothetical protein